jgi:hypothetical protein
VVVVGPFFASWNEPTLVHAEVETRVDQEPLFTGLIRIEEAACCSRADMCRRWCLLLWFPLLAVLAGRGTLLRSVSEAALVPAEGGYGVATGGGSSVWSAIPGAGVRIPGAGTRVAGAEGRVPEAGAETVLLGAECRHLAREFVDLLQKCGVVGGCKAPEVSQELGRFTVAHLLERG